SRDPAAAAIKRSPISISAQPMKKSAMASLRAHQAIHAFQQQQQGGPRKKLPVHTTAACQPLAIIQQQQHEAQPACM
ncbi:hypothetical protein Dimus_004048, partial [Dionaea muscipula]